MNPLYKIMTLSDWQHFQNIGIFEGSSDDRRDGYIHLSSALQWPETLARHFAGLNHLYLLSLAQQKLEHALRWEASRGGQLFPHFYGPLLKDMVARVQGLTLVGGIHQLTDDHDEKGV